MRDVLHTYAGLIWNKNSKIVPYTEKYGRLKTTFHIIITLINNNSPILFTSEMSD